MAAPDLILASASPRRRELLALLGLPFEVVPSAYEERLPDRHPDPAALAEHLATEKALDVARSRPDAVVIGADTIVALGDRVYGKPAGAAGAERMLWELSGKTHVVVTGVALAGGQRAKGRGQRVAGHEIHAFSVTTEVTFRALEEAEIRAYAATGEPMDKAGAYAIQGYGALLIEGIRGDYPNVVGLPLAPLALALRELGISILGKGRA
jgi:septum formation protein